GVLRMKILAALFMTIAVGQAGIAQQRGPARDIVKITDDLYRVRNGAWYGLFLVTTEGIAVVDPISTDVAKWLKTQLDERFPRVPVRYVIYSHSHWDHIEGGAVFADTARFVAQEGVARNMDGR